jgi:UDP-3-O-[3-hydroxymyristoyl] glucosamine N-acyltransferase
MTTNKEATDSFAKRKLFFSYRGPQTIASLLGVDASLRLARGEKGALFYNVASLTGSMAEDVSFFHNPAYREDLRVSKAGAIVTHPRFCDLVPEGAAVLTTEVPLKAFAKIAHLFYQEHSSVGIHPSAIIDPSASVGKNCSIGPGTVIGEGVRIDDGTSVGASVVVERFVKIGCGCNIASQVTLSHAEIGNYVTIKPGARIGQKGFGFYLEGEDLVTQPQLGGVVIGDYVEVGANTTIDRGSLKDTRIHAYARIDNLVQIAHNVSVGKSSILASQVGIAGSTTLGNGVLCGGQVGISGHLFIQDGVKIAAKSGVMKDIGCGKAVAGIPAVDRMQWLRQNVFLSRINSYNTIKK